MTRKNFDGDNYFVELRRLTPLPGANGPGPVPVSAYEATIYVGRNIFHVPTEPWQARTQFLHTGVAARDQHPRAMGKLLRAMVLLPAFGLASCGGGGDGSIEVDTAPLESADPQSHYVIGFGETVSFDGLAVEFTSIAEDSRCPNNPLVLCVWEGNARILLTATRGNVTGVIELNTHPRFPVDAVFEGYGFILHSLDPYPGVNPIPVHAYEATVSIIRVSP